MDGRYRKISNGINSVDESLFGTGSRGNTAPKSWVSFRIVWLIITVNRYAVQFVSDEIIGWAEITFRSHHDMCQQWSFLSAMSLLDRFSLKFTCLWTNMFSYWVEKHIPPISEYQSNPFFPYSQWTSFRDCNTTSCCRENCNHAQWARENKKGSFHENWHRIRLWEISGQSCSDCKEQDSRRKVISSVYKISGIGKFPCIKSIICCWWCDKFVAFEVLNLFVRERKQL